MASRDEIAWLKENWMFDPSFDLEDAPGFEEHRDELRAWRFAYEADDERRELVQLRLRARQNGRTVAQQRALERASATERRHRKAAERALLDLFRAAGLRRSGPGPYDLLAVISAIVDDLVRAAEARFEASRLSSAPDDDVT